MRTGLGKAIFSTCKRRVAYIEIVGVNSRGSRHISDRGTVRKGIPPHQLVLRCVRLYNM
jgi:hypothetical protein